MAEIEQVRSTEEALTGYRDCCGGNFEAGLAVPRVHVIRVILRVGLDTKC